MHGRLGIEGSREAVEARRWAEAAADVRSKALEAGGDGVDAARRIGTGTGRGARSAGSELSRRIAGRPVLRRRGSDGEDED